MTTTATWAQGVRRHREATKGDSSLPRPASPTTIAPLCLRRPARERGFSGRAPARKQGAGMAPAAKRRPMRGEQRLQQRGASEASGDCSGCEASCCSVSCYSGGASRSHPFPIGIFQRNPPPSSRYDNLVISLYHCYSISLPTAQTRVMV